MWDETHNTYLVLKIRRIVTYEGPQNQKSVVEITADLPLFGQREKDEAGVYGEGVGKGTLFGEIPGVGFLRRSGIQNTGYMAGFQVQNATLS